MKPVLPVLALSAAMPALAHGGDSVHVHPHNAEILLAGLAVAGVLWLARRLTR